MANPRVLVLGATGMLGSSVVAALAKGTFSVLQASRTSGIRFDAELDNVDELLGAAQVSAGDYVINCVGLTKSHIQTRDAITIEKAVRLNSLFPAKLAVAAARRGCRVIQVATDCVYSGQDGNYNESSPHDALDIYGKTKSLGEVSSTSVMILRCSLIGPELPGRRTLFFEWVRSLKRGSKIEGYVNHRWNGLTSKAFGNVIEGIIQNDLFLPGLQHLVPADWLDKRELIKLELEYLKRDDVIIESHTTEFPIDRTLATENWSQNNQLFLSAGFKQVPTIREMMAGLEWESLREG
jgi:dTDP-4-dehydrorhamnose reductase